MPKVFTSDKQKIGKLGEELAKKFLMKHGYSILEENYTKKYGEIDLIAQKEGNLHFVEVKSLVSRQNVGGQAHETNQKVSRVTEDSVPRETPNSVPRVTGQTYDPLSNVHPGKLKRLSRVIQVYLLTHPPARIGGTGNWQFDVITVCINEKDRVGTVSHIKDIVL